MSTAITVLLPHPEADNPPPWPTLYLLHGRSDDHTAWTRQTALERYLAGRNLAVVMPDAARSYYTDMAHGQAYWQYISEELPELVRTWFPLAGERSHNFVAGLSMGGYGAFKLALGQPGRYAAAASLSGALDVARLMTRESDPDEQREILGIFDDPAKIDGSDADLFHLAAALTRSEAPQPSLYQICGQDDFLYDDNQRFRQHAQQLGLNLKYEQDPGFGHSWDYWDLAIQRVLDWLPLPQASE